MNKTEISVRIHILQQELTFYKGIRGCSMCDNWKNSKCSLYNSVPPDDVRVDGCDQFVWDSIPF